MKFPEDVYFSTGYMHSEFQKLACAFGFFITFCSRCGMKCDTVCRPSFLHDHFTTQHSDFSSFLAVSTTDKPVNRIIHAYALT